MSNSVDCGHSEHNHINKTLDKEEQYTIRLLEMLFQQIIPIVPSLEGHQVGMLVQHGHVIALKICRQHRLTLLPFIITSLTQLEILDLRYNRLVVLPEVFDRLRHLKHLYLYGNPLKRLPKSLMRLPIRPEIDI